jgi:hypothetical protein
VLRVRNLVSIHPLPHTSSWRSALLVKHRVNYTFIIIIIIGRPRRRWMDNIRMDLGEVGRSDVDWIDLAQDRNRWRAIVNSVLNLRVP